MEEGHAHYVCLVCRAVSETCVCSSYTDPPGQAPSSVSFAVEELGLYEGFKVMLRVSGRSFDSSPHPLDWEVCVTSTARRKAQESGRSRSC